MDLQFRHGTADVSSQAEMEFRVLTEKLRLLPTIALKTRKHGVDLINNMEGLSKIISEKKREIGLIETTISKVKYLYPFLYEDLNN